MRSVHTCYARNPLYTIAGPRETVHAIWALADMVGYRAYVRREIAVYRGLQGVHVGRSTTRQILTYTRAQTIYLKPNLLRHLYRLHCTIPYCTAPITNITLTLPQKPLYTAKYLHGSYGNAN